MNKYFQKISVHWYIFVYLLIYALKWLEIIDSVSPVIGMIFVFLIGYYFVIQPIIDGCIENRISNLIMLRTLQKKRIVTNEDLYLAQNELIGDTPMSDIEKLKKVMKRNNSYLEDYKTDQEILELRKKYNFLLFSIFEYFRDLKNNSSESFINEKKIKKE